MSLIISNNINSKLYFIIIYKENHIILITKINTKI